MNTSRSYDLLTPDEKRQVRAMNEEMSNRYLHALGGLNSLKHVGNAHSHSDPQACLEEIKCAAQFSEIPREFRKQTLWKSKAHTAESVVKHHMINDVYEGALTQRSGRQSTTHSSNLSLVDLSNPLPLSFEARRESIMKRQAKKAESYLSGLFSKNKELNPAVPQQGPVPDLYQPLESARRFEIEREKKAVAEMNTANRVIARSKVEVMTPKNPPVLLGKKVPADFVPNCFNLAEVGNGKDIIKQKQEERQRKMVGLPFK